MCRLFPFRYFFQRICLSAERYTSQTLFSLPLPAFPVCFSWLSVFASYLFAVENYSGRSYYGGPDCVCQHCNVVFWYQERVLSLSSYAQRRIVYHLCCRGGHVSLPKHRPFPPPLCDLIKFNGGPASNSFMRLIRQYNSMFAFTSLGVDIDRSINTGRGPYIFRINGVVHHRIGSLIPDEGNRPQYAQLYIYDTANEVQNRLAIHSSDHGADSAPNAQIVQSLISMFDQCNPLVKQFRMA